MKIRKVTLSEKDKVLSIYQSLIGTPGCTWSNEYPAMEDVIDDIVSNALYGMYMNDSLVAVATASAHDDYDDLNSLYGNLDRACVLSRVGVPVEFQGQGFAKKLIMHIEKDISLQGFDGVHLLVSKTNPKAIRLYESMSYKRRGEAFLYDHDWYYYQKRFEVR